MEFDLEAFKAITNYEPISGCLTYTKAPSPKHEYLIGTRAYFVDESHHKGNNLRSYVQCKGNKVSAARYIWWLMTNEYPSGRILMRDEDRTNLAWDNLYESKANIFSSPKYSKATGKQITSSGVVGVSWNRQKLKWHAYLRKDRKQIHLGYYSLFEDAVKARKDGEAEYFNYFPRFN